MRPVSSISVLVPTYQGARFLDRLLEALAGQRSDRPFDLLVVDSGSSDGTLEILELWRARFPVPMRVLGIQKVEFDHGDTRNLLAARSSGDLLVYLTQDAIPTSRDWLERLAAHFADPEVGAAYCRNVPRRDALPETRILSAGDPGYSSRASRVHAPDPASYAALSSHERRLLYNFNDVASAVRRELWERHPFPRASFGEDVLMARALLEAGYAIAYDATATVEHSHDYGPDEAWRRAFVDGRFNAEWLGRVAVASAGDARALARRMAADDRRAIAELGLAPEDESALAARVDALRRATFDGLAAGAATERRRPPSVVLDHPSLSILYVVHGFPPDTWAGTEVYTSNLAREMLRRGHKVAVFARTPGRGAEPDFSVREDRFEDLRVLRMTHRLQHARLRESYEEPRAEEAFRRVLLDERPDVVHFQHLIHTSTGLVREAKEHGAATLITCHDYWALCSRVQLIRPDGVRCERNMGSGCLLCVKETALGRIPLAKRLDAAGDLLVGAARTLANGSGDAWSRRAEEYLDLRAREEVVPGAYAAADLRVSPSRFLRDRLLASGRFDPHDFVYSDNGMRTDHVRALAKRPDPEGRVRFGFVGSLVWYKGGEVLLRAMRRLAGRPAVLHVHGDFRPDEDPHHAALAALAGENVRFLGRFDNERLSDVYAELDVLVVPSVWWENSPITIHEAFLAHTPVVASDIGGMAEYVQHGQSGLCFCVGDDRDLARTLARFLDEPDLVARLSAEFPAVKTIEEDAADTEFRYRGLVARSRGRLTRELAGARP